MLTSVYEQNKRTLITSAVLLLAISFAYSDNLWRPDANV